MKPQSLEGFGPVGSNGPATMTIADSRAVAHRWLRNGEVVGHWMDGAPTERQMQAGRDCSQIGGVAWTVEYVSPLSLLAEAERENQTILVNAVAWMDLANEREKTIAALQSRLDAVLRLADRWEKLAETHGVRAFTGNDHRLFANELRAALGGESPGNEEERK